MGINEIENSGLSEESKKALQSETWQKVRDGLRARREVKHFSEEAGADNEYGPEWSAVVKEYFKTGYKAAEKGCDLEVGGVIYKVLHRDKVTAFYDSDGDTLFDVTDERLAKEYETLEKDNNISVEEEGELGGSKDITEKKEEVEKPDSVPTVSSENATDVKERAIKKLEDEFKNAKDKSFADPIIKYLLKRCENDKGLSEDVLQRHKTWEKCLRYIYSLAMKQASGNCAAVRDDVVYEWAEDYYHRDDKAEEEKKAKKAAGDKAKKTKSVVERKTARAKNAADKAEKVPALQKAEAPKEPPKPKRNGKEMDGQLDMFAMMGM